MRLNETWTVGHPRGLQEHSVWSSPVGQTKPRFQMIPMQTVGDTRWERGVHHYRGNPPQLRYTPTADAACRCRGNPLQQRDSATGCGGEQQNNRARAGLTTAGQSLGRQTVASVWPSWARPQWTSKNKARTHQHRAFEKKRVFLMSSVAAESNIAA